MNSQEENNIISQYSRKNVLNNLEDKEIVEESNSMNELVEPSQEMEEEITNFQSYELKDNEDITVNATTRQKLDAYLSNGIFLHILSITSFYISMGLIIFDFF